MNLLIKSERFIALENKYKDIFYCEDKNNIGNIVLIGKNIKLKELKNKETEILEYITYCCFHSLNISNKYNKPAYNIHIYIDNWKMENFSIRLFRYLNDNLKETFEDVLNCCYIYNRSPMFKIIFNVIYKFIDPETRPKIKYIKL
jgi:hypothetical protein